MNVSNELYQIADDLRAEGKNMPPDIENMLYAYAQRIEELARAVEDMETDLANYYERGGL